MRYTNRVTRLEQRTAVNLATLATATDAELEAIVGNDATGRWLRSLSDAELEAIVNGEQWQKMTKKQN